MRWSTLALALAVVGVQGSLWLGEGNMPQVVRLEQQLAAQQRTNEAARERNQRTVAEVSDLKEGLEMVEEKARAELGMVKSDEILVQYTRATAAHATPAHDPATVPGALPNTGSGAAGGPAPAASGP
ncbi:MAG: septum formation initiator family protein [Proteobacteria bacterium]|nr:septum formation initiator family protein [Pseudomonadota bacterium]